MAINRPVRWDTTGKLANGHACALSDCCLSGFCVDGFCCDTACGGGDANDCQACAVSAGAATDGTCALRGSAAAPVTCRAAAGQCDVAELCTGVSADCPTNGFKASTEACTGGNNGGVCDEDAADHCAGTDTTCVDAFKAATVTCRASAGPCDVAELCTGSTSACPVDAFKAATVTCRGAAGPCDVAELCTGATSSCPADVLRDATSTCRPAAGDCDLAERCTGNSAACPFDDKSTSVCRPSAGPCDLPEFCDGYRNTCPGDRKSSSICRPSASACDAREVCDGISNECPPDAPAQAGLPCGAPTCQDGSYTTAPVCDGAFGCLPGRSGSCGAYRCGVEGTGGDCLGRCAGDGDCVSGRHCDGGSCVPTLSLGQGCGRDAQCQSGHCFALYALFSGVQQFCTASCDDDGACGQFQSVDPGHSSGYCNRNYGNYYGDGRPGLCLPRGPNGSLCSSADQCQSFQCADNLCARGCSADADCSGGFCNGGSCQPLRLPGESCRENSQCGSGHCVDAVCCNSACPSIQNVDFTTGQPDGTWTCGHCAADNGASADGVCTYGTSTGLCVQDMFTSCGAFGTYRDLSCRTSCTSDAHCASGAFCDGAGQCRYRRALGQGCGGPSDCTSGFCVDGVCCDSACGGGSTADCQNCRGAPGRTDGTCGPVTAGEVCRASSGACTAAARCDGSSLSCPDSAPTSAGTACGAAASCDGGQLQGAEVCDGAFACKRPDSVSCDAYICGVESGAAACKTSCQSAADCSPSYLCTEGHQCSRDGVPPSVVVAQGRVVVREDPRGGVVVPFAATVTDPSGITSVAVYLRGHRLNLGPLLPGPDGIVRGSPRLTEVQPFVGDNDLLIEATDGAGNIGRGHVLVILDDAAPVVTIESPAPGPVGGGPLPVRVRVTDLTTPTVTVNGQAALVTPLVDPSGHTPGVFVASASVSFLAEGSQPIVVEAVDEAEIRASQSVAVAVDLSAPLVSASALVGPAGSIRRPLTEGALFGAQAGDTLLYEIGVDEINRTSGTIEAASLAACQSASECAAGQTCAQGVCRGSFELPAGGGVHLAAMRLREGENTLTITVTNEIGLRTVFQRTLIYDKTPPTGTFDVPAAVGPEAVELAFLPDYEQERTGVSFVSFDLDGLALPAATRGADGRFTVPFDPASAPVADVADGSHTLRARVRDGVGNEAVLGTRLVLDRTAPEAAVTLLTPSTDGTVPGTFQVRVRAADQTSGVASLHLVAGAVAKELRCDASPCVADVTIKVLSPPPGTPPVDDASTLTLLGVGGALTLSATARDRAGNEVSAANVEVFVDNVPPPLAIKKPGTRVGDTFTTLAQMTDPRDKSFKELSCQVGAAAPHSASNRQLKFSVTLLTELPTQLDGELVVKCSSVDKVGNRTSLSKTVQVERWRLSMAPASWSMDTPPAALDLLVRGNDVAGLLAGRDPGTGSTSPASVARNSLTLPGNGTVQAIKGTASSADTLALGFDPAQMLNALRTGISKGEIKPKDPAARVLTYSVTATLNHDSRPVRTVRFTVKKRRS